MKPRWQKGHQLSLQLCRIVKVPLLCDLQHSGHMKQRPYRMEIIYL